MKIACPADTTFGMWLSEEDFIPCDEDNYTSFKVLVDRHLPLEGDFVCVPLNWLEVKESPINREVKKSQESPRALYKFRTIDESCITTALDTYGSEMIVLDITPYYFESSSSRRRLTDAILDLLENCIPRDVRDIISDSLQNDNLNTTTVLISGVFFKGATPGFLKRSNLSNCLLQVDLRPNVFILVGNNLPAQKDLWISTVDPINIWVENTTLLVRSERTKLLEREASLKNELRALSAVLGSYNAVLRGTKTYMQAELSKCISTLSSNPRVKNCSLQGRYLVLSTKDVVYENTKGSYFIGQFEFKLSFKEGIRVRNCKSPVLERLHPHGFSDSVCLGGYDASINNAFKAFDYTTLLLTVLEWTFDVNENDRDARTSLGRDYPTLKNGVLPSKVKLSPTRWVDFCSSWQELPSYTHADDSDLL